MIYINIRDRKINAENNSNFHEAHDKRKERKRASERQTDRQT